MRKVVPGCEPNLALGIAEVQPERLDRQTTRKALAERRGANVIIRDTYGISECFFSDIDCGGQPGGVHVPEHSCHAYSVDPDTGERAAEGQVRENVVSSATRIAQVFIKYRTHDLVERY